ncbi:LPXTG cell wall anchor domain-containing protein [Enterococcus casseliflavus]|nr:LPXTG cell wall anchor domain-containing protein [Enterococcus casseliflavus]
MKRIKSLLVLGLLSLFLGVTTVTTYAQSNSATVEAGICFIDDSSSGQESDEHSNSTGSSEWGQSVPSDQTNHISEGKLPQTGEKSSAAMTILGMIFLGILFCSLNTSSQNRR